MDSTLKPGRVQQPTLSKASIPWATQERGCEPQLVWSRNNFSLLQGPYRTHLHVFWRWFLEPGGLVSSPCSKLIAPSFNFFLQLHLCCSCFFSIHLCASCSVSMISWDMDKPDKVPVFGGLSREHRNADMCGRNHNEGMFKDHRRKSWGRNPCSAGNPRPTRVPGSPCLPRGNLLGVFTHQVNLPTSPLPLPLRAAGPQGTVLGKKTAEGQTQEKQSTQLYAAKGPRSWVWFHSTPLCSLKSEPWLLEGSPSGVCLLSHPRQPAQGLGLLLHKCLLKMDKRAEAMPTVQMRKLSSRRGRYLLYHHSF